MPQVSSIGPQSPEALDLVEAGRLVEAQGQWQFSKFSATETAWNSVQPGPHGAAGAVDKIVKIQDMGMSEQAEMMLFNNADIGNLEQGY